jgi:RimJ/RimL family protein N-acetyltransferase
MVRITPFTEAFLTERYVAWLNDPQVTRFSEQRHRTHTLETCRAYFESFRGTPHQFFAIVDRHGDHIGNINAYVDAPNRTADVGILIGNPNLWGRGYGTAAWSQFCDHLLAGRGLRMITAGTAACNHGMRGIFRKTGMVPIGRKRGVLLIDATPTDMVFAAFTKPAAESERTDG